MHRLYIGGKSEKLGRNVVLHFRAIGITNVPFKGCKAEGLGPTLDSYA
jgi:hypothetical protein